MLQSLGSSTAFDLPTFHVGVLRNVNDATAVPFPRLKSSPFGFGVFQLDVFCAQSRYRRRCSEGPFSTPDPHKIFVVRVVNCLDLREYSAEKFKISSRILSMLSRLLTCTKSRVGWGFAPADLTGNLSVSSPQTHKLNFERPLIFRLHV